MANFKPACEYTLYWEGSHYTNDPADPGGPTKWGIILGTLKQWGWAGDINQDGVIDEKDIKSLTHTQAIQIYKDVKWDAGPYNRIRNQRIATKFFDTAVNMGLHQSSLILQRAVNSAYSGARWTPDPAPQLLVDGKVGPKTLTAINLLGDTTISPLLSAMISEQAGIYRLIVNKKTSSRKFLAGWLRRAYSIPGHIIFRDYERLN